MFFLDNLFPPSFTIIFVQHPFTTSFPNIIFTTPQHLSYPQPQNLPHLPRAEHLEDFDRKRIIPLWKKTTAAETWRYLKVSCNKPQANTVIQTKRFQIATKNGLNQYDIHIHNLVCSTTKTDKQNIIDMKSWRGRWSKFQHLLFQNFLLGVRNMVRQQLLQLWKVLITIDYRYLVAVERLNSILWGWSSLPWLFWLLDESHKSLQPVAVKSYTIVQP